MKTNVIDGVHREIIERIEDVLTNYYVIKKVDKPHSNVICYNIYRKPKFELDDIGVLLFKLLAKEYYFTQIEVDKNVVTNYVYSEKELVINKGKFELLFNSIDDIEFNFIKSYMN